MKLRSGTESELTKNIDNNMDMPSTCISDGFGVRATVTIPWNTTLYPVNDNQVNTVIETEFGDSIVRGLTQSTFFNFKTIDVIVGISDRRFVSAGFIVEISAALSVCQEHAASTAVNAVNVDRRDHIEKVIAHAIDDCVYESSFNDLWGSNAPDETDGGRKLMKDEVGPKTNGMTTSGREHRVRVRMPVTTGKTCKVRVSSFATKSAIELLKRVIAGLQLGPAWHATADADEEVHARGITWDSSQQIVKLVPFVCKRSDIIAATESNDLQCGYIKGVKRLRQDANGSESGRQQKIMKMTGPLPIIIPPPPPPPLPSAQLDSSNDQEMAYVGGNDTQPSSHLINHIFSNIMRKGDSSAGKMPMIMIELGRSDLNSLDQEAGEEEEGEEEGEMSYSDEFYDDPEDKSYDPEEDRDEDWPGRGRRMTRQRKSKTIKFIPTEKESRSNRLKRVLQNLPKNVANAVTNRASSIKNMSHETAAKHEEWLDVVSRLPIGKYSSIISKKHGHEATHRSVLEKAKQSLDSVTHGMGDVKKVIMQMVGQQLRSNGSKLRALALKGPPGCGKTTIATKGIGPALSRPVHVINLGGAKDVHYLKGHNFTYVGSKAGAIVDALLMTDRMDPIIVFDELDKISDTPEGKEIIHVLMSLVDPVQNTSFREIYLSDIPLDLSRALIVFTFNDASSIDPILLDRLNIVTIPDLSSEEKTRIVIDYIIPRVAKDMGLEHIEHDADALEEIIGHVTLKCSQNNAFDSKAHGTGLRGFEKFMEHVVASANLRELTTDDLHQDGFRSRLRIKREDVIEAIKSREKMQDDDGGRAATAMQRSMMYL